MDYWVAVVDDEALSLTNVKNILHSQGMKVSCLKSGEALLKYMENHDPDLILLDIIMPEMDGFETFQALRKQEEHLGKNKTPVIFLTGENNNEVERRGLTAGASDFIRKPIDQEILISRINNTIQNNKTIESLTEEATVDKLTGFLNKNSGTRKISNMCLDQSGAMMIFDLDNFKLVNDLYGHDMGDKVLEAFSDIVRYNTRERDVVSRIGGDEFLAFFCDLKSDTAVKSLTKRLNDQIMSGCKSLMGNEFDIPIGISVGVVFVPEIGTDFSLLFQYADSSLYRVKQNGKHGYEIYDPYVDTSDDMNDLTRELGRVTHLVAERRHRSSAMLLGQDAFTSDYRLLIRMIDYFKGKANKLLFSVTPKEPGQKILDTVLRFGEVLQENLRKCDIIFQNRPNQFFVFLPEITDNDNESFINDILEAWENEDLSQKVDITYVSETVLYSDLSK